MERILQALLCSEVQGITLFMRTAHINKLIFFCIILVTALIIIILCKTIAKRDAAIIAMEKKVREHQMMFQSMQEGFVLFRIIFSQGGEPPSYCLIDANPAAMLITGLNIKEINNSTLLKTLPHADIDIAEILDKAALTGEPVNDEIYFRHMDKYLLINIYKPEWDRIVIIFSDITQKKLAEETVIRQKLSFEALFRNSSDAIVRLDQDHRVADINEKFTVLFGYTIDEIYGMELDRLIAFNDKLEEANQLTIDLLNGCNVVIESVRFGSDRQPREVSIKGVPIMLNNRIIGGYGIYSDISQRKKAEKEILYMNYHDQLTGLYNRRFFEEELKRLDTERNLPISVIMADVNGLKLYNDAFGHAAGDKLLVKAAELIKGECREDEIIARLGGDEFVILLPKTNSQEAEKIIERMKTSISKIRFKSLKLSISFGWGTKAYIEQNMREVIQNAEDYMYRSKLSERSRIREKTAKTIIGSFHKRNKTEEQHSKRVSYFCRAIGMEMGLKESELAELETAGFLHDIGKIAVDEKILNKQGSLEAGEWNEIKRHPEVGYRILRSLNDNVELAEFVLAHHERWDGEGYPKGLKGEKIPLQSRIIMVANAYDVMTIGRAYKKPISKESAVLEIRENSGTKFDPKIAEIFIEKVIHKVPDLIDIYETGNNHLFLTEP